MAKLEPEYMDEVKHITDGTSGIVRFSYVIDGVKYFDVESSGGYMIYQTLASKWEVVTKYVG